MRIALADGSPRDVQAGVTVAQALHELGVAMDHKVVAAKVNGHLVDLTAPLAEDATLVPIDVHTPDGLEIMRHSTSHLMAEAVRTLFPGVKVAIGPAIEAGFYYDFDTKEPFTPEDLARIEAKMAELAAQDLSFEREEVPKEEAIRLFEEKGETYKVELLREIDQDEVSLYRQGSFVDLCRGPHVPSTSYLQAFKLTGISGAYWRGDERLPMLQRIYGTAFPTQEELERHLELIEEAKRRDHRRLGRELGLFAIEDEAGPGLVIYHPKGALLRSLIEDFERRLHLKRGYLLVMGPQMLRADLWAKSGHMENYQDHMYFTEAEGQVYGLKPMNCVAHMLIYKSGSGATGSCPCATSSSARCCAMSGPGSCTASPGCANSPRTTPTSSAPPTRWKVKFSASWTWWPKSWPFSALIMKWSSPPGPRSPSAPTRIGIWPPLP
jgi:threonyl-tRNA synthetase